MLLHSVLSPVFTKIPESRMTVSTLALGFPSHTAQRIDRGELEISFTLPFVQELRVLWQPQYISIFINVHWIFLKYCGNILWLDLEQSFSTIRPTMVLQIDRKNNPYSKESVKHRHSSVKRNSILMFFENIFFHFFEAFKIMNWIQYFQNILKYWSFHSFMNLKFRNRKIVWSSKLNFYQILIKFILNFDHIIHLIYYMYVLVNI